MVQTMEEVVSCRIRLSKKPILSLLIFTFDPSCLSGEYDTALFALGKICSECRGREGEDSYSPAGYWCWPIINYDVITM